MNRGKKILLISLVVLLLVAIAFIVWKLSKPSSGYYAVFLRTGDIYFGHLVYFPSFGLRNVYTIQVNPQNQQNPLSIQRFVNVFWGPEDWLKINREEVVWVTRLREDSQLAQILRTNPNLLPPAPQQPAQLPPPTPPPSTQGTSTPGR